MKDALCIIIENTRTYSCLIKMRPVSGGGGGERGLLTRFLLTTTSSSSKSLGYCSVEKRFSHDIGAVAGQQHNTTQIAIDHVVATRFLQEIYACPVGVERLLAEANRNVVGGGCSLFPETHKNMTRNEWTSGCWNILPLPLRYPRKQILQNVQCSFISHHRLLQRMAIIGWRCSTG